MGGGHRSIQFLFCSICQKTTEHYEGICVDCDYMAWEKSRYDAEEDRRDEEWTDNK